MESICAMDQLTAETMPTGLRQRLLGTKHSMSANYDDGKPPLMRVKICGWDPKKLVVVGHFVDEGVLLIPLASGGSSAGAVVAANRRGIREEAAQVYFRDQRLMVFKLCASLCLRLLFRGFS